MAEPSVLEVALRALIMRRLRERTAQNGGVVSRAELSDFDLGTQRRRLIDQSRGIWNPHDLQATLTIVHSPTGPYADESIAGGWFRYDYRAGTTDGDNAKLRRAGELDLPLILLEKLRPNQYVPIFPVYVVGDDPVARQFLIALDESLRLMRDPLNPSEAERRYADVVTKRRLHQPMFRGRVIQAYQTQCAICALRIGQLLEAAHITPDAEETGRPIVSNGLCLCNIHHVAYDRNLLGIRPDAVVEINRDLLEDVDGPMLRHGLQEMHGRALIVPSRRVERPDPERLAARYDQFKAS